MARASITRRLAIGLSIGTAILWLCAAAIALSVLTDEVGEAFDDTLQQSAFRLLPLALHDLREPEERNERRIPVAEGQPDANFIYYVHGPDGRPVLVSDDMPAELVPDVAPDGFFDVEGRRAYSLSDHRSGFGIVLIETDGRRNEVFRESAGALLWPLAGLVPLIAVGIWAAVRLAMRPVEKLRREIAERGERNLSGISSHGHPAELAPIADEVARLLDRLRTALDAERAFAAMSAHELRTPIAGALAQTQQLARELEEHPEAKRLKTVEQALKKLSELSENLLRLSRLQAGFAKSEEVHDVLPVLRLLLRDAPEAELIVGEDADTHIAIDLDAFGVVMSNLLRNAKVHGAEGDKTRIVCGPGRIIHVSNAGPVVTPELLGQLGAKFVRGDTKANGTGLGLALVKTVMDETGGRLELLSPRSGHEDGFEVRLIWPD